jgi:glycosyltransferase involved in cell wall biosynthesis
VTAENLRVLLVGGSDVRARIPLMREYETAGLSVAVSGTVVDPDFERAGFEQFPYAAWGPTTVGKSLKTLAAAVQAFDPHVVHSFDTVPGLLTARLSSQDRSRVYMRTVTGIGWSYSLDGPQGFALRFGYGAAQKLIGRRIGYSVFQNRDDLALFTSKRWSSPVNSKVIVGSGVDLRRFVEDAAHNDVEVRAELGIAEGPVVVMATRLLKVKGIDTFIDAARQMPRCGEHRVQFVLVGDQETSSRGIHVSSEHFAHADFTYAGPVSGIERVFRLASAVVLPTRYREGVPRVLIEAAALGKPLIASDMPGCREIVRHEDSGLLVQPHNASQLATALVGVLCNPALAAQLGHRARHLAHTEFSLPVVANQYVELYQRLSVT